MEGDSYLITSGAQCAMRACLSLTFRSAMRS